MSRKEFEDGISSFSSKTIWHIKPHTNEETLFSHKSHKEILLSLIKSKIDILLKPNLESNLKTDLENNSKRNKINYFKELLSDLKRNLSYMLNEKKTKEEYLQDKVNNKKEAIQNKIFNSNKKKNKDEESKVNIETDISDKIYGKDELSKLKMMNFKAENEIQKLDFLIEGKRYINKYIKVTSFYPEEKNIFFYYNCKLNSDEIDDCLSSHVKEAKDYLNNLTIEKGKQNEEIKKLEKNINRMRYNYEIEDIISKSDIIYEDSQESKETKTEKKTNNCIATSNNENDQNYTFNSNEKDIIASQINEIKNLEIINKTLRNILDENNLHIKKTEFIEKIINKRLIISKINDYDQEKSQIYINQMLKGMGCNIINTDF